MLLILLMALLLAVLVVFICSAVSDLRDGYYQ